MTSHPRSPRPRHRFLRAHVVLGIVLAVLATACSVASVPEPLLEANTAATGSSQGTDNALAEPESRSRGRAEPPPNEAPGILVPPTILVTPVDPPPTTEPGAEPTDDTSTTTTTSPGPAPTSTTTTTVSVAGGPPSALTLQHQAAMTLSSAEISGSVIDVVFSTAEVFETYSWYFETTSFETYVEAYVNPDELIAPGSPRVEGVDSGVMLFNNAAAASDRLAAGTADAAADSYLSGFAQFEVAGVGNEAVGLRMEYTDVVETQVVFRRNAVLALVTVTHSDTADHAADAIDLARVMDARVEGVLNGSIPPHAIPGLDGNAWFSPTARLDSFSFESLISVSGVTAPIDLSGSGRAIGEEAMECDLTVSGATTAQRYGLIALDGLLYANPGTGYITTSPSDPQFGPLPRLCGGSVDFWEGLGFTESDIRWFAGEAYDSTTKDGIPARHYDLSGTSAAAQILRLNPEARADRFEVWYAAGDLWPIAVEIEISGSTVSAFGATYTGSGAPASVTVSASVGPGPVADVVAPGSGGGDTTA